MMKPVSQLARIVLFGALAVAALDGAARAAPPPPTPPTPAGPAGPANPLGVGPPGDPVRAGAAFDRAMTFDRDGDLTAACERFLAAAVLAPSWGIARYQAAHCVRVLGDFAGSPAPRSDADPTRGLREQFAGSLAPRSDAGLDPLAELAMAERLDVKRTPVYLEKARLLEDRGELAAASVAYREALAAQPAEVRAQQGAARTATTEGPRAALERLQGYVAAQPGDTAGWLELARLAEAQKKFAIADKAYEQAIVLARNKRRAIAALGAYGQRTHQNAVVERALKLLRQLP